FATLADHDQLGDVLGGPVKRVREGQGDVNGVGSVRKIGFWPIDFDETVTEFVPCEKIAYRITRGSPLKNHHGEIDFAADGDGCRIRWRIGYEMPPVAGHVVKLALRRLITRGLRKLEP
ncbi:MAG: SRPBCC family protein, partial [Panacagrimonas sp.]